MDAAIASMSVTACEEARAQLAVAAEELAAARAPELQRRVEFVADALGTAAEAPPDRLARALGHAMGALANVLGTLQSCGRAETEHATERVARTMATLYPLRRALQSKTEPPPAEPAAMPLVQKKKKRPTLEIVPDEAGRSASDLAIPLVRPAGAERRERDRVALDVDIGLHSETNFFAGFGDDISEGGLFVATYDVKPIGSEMTLSFVLPGGAHVTVRGRVTWTREPHGGETELHPGMGVAFTDIDEPGVEAIRAYMSARPPMFYDG